MKIPFNQSFIIGKELYYISQSVLGGHIAGDGIFTKKCHQLLEQKLGARKVLLTTSCTAALEMSAILSRIEPGDEVILPSFTFVSTANAYHLRGARLVFVDIRPDTLNMDERQLAALVTDRTKAIVPVHYGGVGCEMDTIVDVAQKNGLTVIEDAAQAMNARYKGRYLGTLGDFGTFSFHETKNCICGEAGALVINNPDFIERAEIIREKGTNRSQFFRGEVDKYTWVDIGSSYLPSDLLAAFLFAQLEKMDQIDERRREHYQNYYQLLSPLEESGVLRLPVIPEHCEPCGHVFYILLEDEKTRNALLNHLRQLGIGAVFHYLPLHLSPMGKAMGYRDGEYPVTENLSARLLRLPMFYELELAAQEYITQEINQFFGQ